MGGIDKNQLLTLKEFAALVNLDERRVKQLAKTETITKAERGKYPLYAVTEYIRYQQELVQQRKIQPEREEGALDPEAERARKDKEHADKLALENRLRREEVVEVAEVEQGWSKIIYAVKSKLLGMGAKLAPVCEGMKAPEIKRRIDAMIRQILQELSENADSEENTE